MAWNRLAYLVAAAVAAACGEGEPAPLDGPDAAMADAAVPAPDAAVHTVDAGGVSPDAGPAVRDAGMTTALDAAIADASRPPAADGGALRRDAGAGVDAAVIPAVPTRYPAGAVRSPVTAAVAGRLQALAAVNPAQDDHVFMKVGASGTVSHNLLWCFAGASQPQYQLDWAGQDASQPTVEWFRSGSAAGSTPFDRVTLAAEVGRTAAWAISGNPSPLERELAALHPRFAFVNYGTNDMNMGTTHRSALFPFHDNLAALLDRLETAGVVPLVSGLGPRADSATAALWVPTYNVVTRGMCEARQIPYLSLYDATRGLPGMGLGSDGLHGNVYQVAGAAQPCVFTSPALAFNANTRNLLTVGMLHAARTAVLTSTAVLDAEPPALQGEGTVSDPFVVDALPFTHAADTRTARSQALHRYPSCDGAQNESGPEVVYRLTLAAQTPLRMLVLDRGVVDVDLHLLGPAVGEASCVARHDRILERRVPAGQHHVVVDTYVPADGVARAGPYLLVILACEPGDPDCG